MNARELIRLCRDYWIKSGEAISFFEYLEKGISRKLTKSEKNFIVECCMSEWNGD